MKALLWIARRAENSGAAVLVLLDTLRKKLGSEDRQLLAAGFTPDDLRRTGIFVLADVYTLPERFGVTVYC